MPSDCTLSRNPMKETAAPLLRFTPSAQPRGTLLHVRPDMSARVFAKHGDQNDFERRLAEQGDREGGSAAAPCTRASIEASQARAERSAPFFGTSTALPPPDFRHDMPAWETFSCPWLCTSQGSASE